MDSIKDVLKDLGLTEKEILIYLSLNKNSELTALNLSKETNIDRTSIYDILEKMVSKGLVSSIQKNSSTFFKTITPEDLLNYYTEKINSLEKIIPELNSMKNFKSEPIKNELFVGKNGLKTVLKDLINNAKEYRVIGIKKEYEEILGYFNEQGILKMNLFNAKEIAIVEKNTKFKKLKNGEYKYLDKKLLSPTSTLIYNDTVVFFIWSQPYFAIRIESKLFRKAQLEYFNILWDVAE